MTEHGARSTENKSAFASEEQVIVSWATLPRSNLATCTKKIIGNSSFGRLSALDIVRAEKNTLPDLYRILVGSQGRTPGVLGGI